MRLRKLVYRNARPLDYTKWKYLFENGSCEDFLGFVQLPKRGWRLGYNIECNNWNPNSSPIQPASRWTIWTPRGRCQRHQRCHDRGDPSDTLSQARIGLKNGWVGMQGIPATMISRICHGFISIPREARKRILASPSAFAALSSNMRTKTAKSTTGQRLSGTSISAAGRFCSMASPIMTRCHWI